MTDRIPRPALLRRTACTLAAVAVATLALAGCATPPADKTELFVTGWSTDITRPLPADAVVTVTLKFHVNGFEPGKFTIVELFDTNLPSGAIKGINKHPPKLATADGETTVTLRLGDALKNPELRQPLRFRFFLLKDRDASGSSPVAQTPTYDIRVDASAR